jgi:hypothetical protein
MEELLPVVIGIAAHGLVLRRARVPARGARPGVGRPTLAAALLAMAAGAAVAVLGGEAAANPWCVPLDAATALAGCGAAAAAARGRAHRRAAASARRAPQPAPAGS